MTLRQAIDRANQRAMETGEERFVVYDPEECETERNGYHVTTEEGLHTDYHYVSDNNVVYCTSWR